jgi:hypothetical protein
MIITWLRFFTLFLLLQRISKLLLTLVRMIETTLSLIIILLGYWVIMATIFTILFQEYLPSTYGSFFLTMRSLFDIAVGDYNYYYLGPMNNTHDVFLMFHAWMTNVFLLNYLIALLTMVYYVMLEGGEYSYKALKYKFYEKFKNVLKDETGIREMFINPPPFNIISFFILPFLFCKKTI